VTDVTALNPDMITVSPRDIAHGVPKPIPLGDPVAYLARELSALARYAETSFSSDRARAELNIWVDDRDRFLALPYPYGEHGGPWHLVHSHKYGDLWAAHKTVFKDGTVEITAFYHRTVPHGTTEEI
jgi:hypothetical protein